MVSVGWLLAAFCIPVVAADSYLFENWTADRGLPQNIIRDILPTPDGYLWLATLDGLVRFDGVRFTVFNKVNSPDLRSTRLISMIRDRDGDLWLCTEASGIIRYHGGRFTTYNRLNGLPNDLVRGAFTTDDRGNLWALSRDSLVQWQPATDRFVDVTPKHLSLPFNPIVWEGGGFWAASGSTLHTFVHGHLVSYPMPRWLPARSIRTVALDQNGVFWLDTEDGRLARLRDGAVERVAPEAAIAYRDARGNAWTVYIGPRLVRYMNDSANGELRKIPFTILREDGEGSLWLATEGMGLYQVRRRLIDVYSKEQGLADRDIYPVYQDRQGAMWIGAWHAGLSRFEDGRFTTYTKTDGLASNLITAIDQDAQGRLWVAAHGGARFFENGRFREAAGLEISSRAVIQAIHHAPDGALWFGTSAGLVRYHEGSSKLFAVQDGLAGEDVRVIIDGAAGEMWIGGYGGLTRFADGKFTHWTEGEGLPANMIRALYRDRDGALWIGTYDGGLARFHGGKFTRYTTNDGLSSDGVFQILEDARGNFWMSSNRGIYRASKRNLDDFAAGRETAITSIAYGRMHGMRSVECNGGYSPAGVRARDGKLWFPTEDGVAVIDPEQVAGNRRSPPVVIESVLVDRKPAPLTGPVKIAPRQTDLEIQYTALSFIDSGQIRFRYRLEGLDSAWVDAGARRAAYYSHVPPGDYTFRVIARNSDGVWNDQGSSIRMTVLGPFYRTWWFQALACLVAAGLGYAAWSYRVAQLEREQAIQRDFSRRLIASQESERQRIAVEMHDTLGQRLVVVKNLALFYLKRQDPAAIAGGAASEIEEISQEAALAMSETREIAYNLRPHLLDRLGLTTAVEGLVETASAASGIRISCELDNIDEVFPEDLRINFYRIVQECLNNMAKHSKATEARVRIERSNGRVVLTVDDNGRGFTPGHSVSEAAGGGLGMIGMSERARLLGGEFAIRSAPGHGTAVRVEFLLEGSRVV